MKFSFSLQCPGEFINNVLELQLFLDETVRGNLHYYDLCKVVNPVNIAYNNLLSSNNFGDINFQIDNTTNTLVEYKPVPINTYFIPFDFEIIGEFLRQHNILPNWIDCNYTNGWYDEELSKWTGDIGKVRLTFLKLYCI